DDELVEHAIDRVQTAPNLTLLIPHADHGADAVVGRGGWDVKVKISVPFAIPMVGRCRGPMELPSERQRPLARSLNPISRARAQVETLHASHTVSRYSSGTDTPRGIHNRTQSTIDSAWTVRG